jgi:hypothetical protein
MKVVWMWVMVATLAAGLFGVAGAQETPPSPPSPKAEPTAATTPAVPTTQPTQAELEKKFEETMTGAVLVGRFTTRGREQNPKEDRYTIVSAKKLFGELWVITAQIEYRGNAVAIPLVVPVKWAGDTPVISVTDLTIPRMGTYTARVMIFRGQYSGMWDAGDHGGLMWGAIERPPLHPPTTTKSTTAPATNKAEQVK